MEVFRRVGNSRDCSSKVIQTGDIIGVFEGIEVGSLKLGWRFVHGG